MTPGGPAPGLIVAAPASGSGKTLVTLALLRHFRNRGLAVASAKAGPDYIDPAFHAAASGAACRNLDSWAMRPETVAGLIHGLGESASLILAEGVMGLFDGAPGGRGSTAELAAMTGWPVVLVVDARGMAASAAALLHGFASYQPGLRPAGVIFNRVSGAGHQRILRAACDELALPCLGCLPRDPALALPERHLGLVQASEHPELEAFLEAAAAWLAAHLDGEALAGLARPTTLATAAAAPGPTDLLPPLGQSIAVATDEAFAFAYPALLESWRRAGAELRTFSPLADQAPGEACDAVYLPGGYPELHAGRLAGGTGFLAGLRSAASRGATLYGECGGFMVLGEGLVDGEGERHAMAGLLPLETGFAAPRLTLGYRRASLVADAPLGPRGTCFRGHEFHYARTLKTGSAQPLFEAENASGEALGTSGLRQGRVLGSFLHLIDREAAVGGVATGTAAAPAA